MCRRLQGTRWVLPVTLATPAAAVCEGAGLPGRLTTEKATRRWALSAMLGVALVAVSEVGHAAPGDLDPTFGTGGEVATDFAGKDDQAFALVLQPDGKLVAAGFAAVGGTGEDFALARYNTDGNLDGTF